EGRSVIRMRYACAATCSAGRYEKQKRRSPASESSCGSWDHVDDLNSFLGHNYPFEVGFAKHDYEIPLTVTKSRRRDWHRRHGSVPWRWVCRIDFGDQRKGAC